jgi:hypothetical protein
MHFIVLAVVGLALLGGLVALLIGHRGWNWGTVVAGVLVLLGATGYLYLAGRLLERERAWRAEINRYHADILRVRDAVEISGPGDEPAPIPNKSSIADLADTRSRWARSLSRVETWRGRHWQGSAFVPPKDGAAGTLSIAAGEQPAGGAEPPAAVPPGGEPPAGGPPAAEPTPPRAPLNAGAEIAVFDQAAVEEGGRFVGLFRVSAVAFDAATRRATLSVVPIAEPDKHDLQVWAQPHDSVVVFENLPVDRWLGYHRTPGPAVEPEKTDPKDLLEAVERRYAELREHGAVLEGAPADLVARITGGEVPPGRYWAEVQFEADHDLDPKVVERIKLLLQPEINREDPLRARTSFAPGDTAAFDLETALALGDKVKILRIVERRPLVDGSVTLLGGPLLPGAGENGLRTDGVTALRRMLEADIEGIEREIERLEAATKSVVAENGVLATEATELTDDLGNWQRDEAAATATVTAFSGRLEQVSRQLDADVRAIGGLGRAVNETVGRLAAAIDQVAPPADGGAPAPGAVAP